MYDVTNLIQEGYRHDLIILRKCHFFNTATLEYWVPTCDPQPNHDTINKENKEARHSLPVLSLSCMCRKGKLTINYSHSMSAS